MHATRAAANTSDNPLKLATRSGWGSSLGGGAMSDEVSEQLVKLITQEVMAILAKQGGTGDAATSGQQARSDSGSANPARAHIAPPIGTCTGDYSKFPELKGRISGSATANSVTPVSTPTPAPTAAPVALSGIITATQLQAAMNAATDGVALLTHDARLTPLANDLARQHAKRVKRLAPSSAFVSNLQPANLPWLWWIEGSCPVVQQVTTQRTNQLRAIAQAHHDKALVPVVRELASAIRNKQAAGGLLFVRNAARAIVYANRCASIRAIVGTCGEAVEQGITEIGANVLVIEYPHHGPKSTSAMIDRLIGQHPSVSPATERELADLHRCG